MHPRASRKERVPQGKHLQTHIHMKLEDTGHNKRKTITQSPCYSQQEQPSLRLHWHHQFR